VRVCGACHDRARITASVHDEINVFLLLCERGFVNLVDWGKLQSVCSRFKMAVDELLFLLRRVLTKKNLPNPVLTSTETRLIRLHRTVLREHVAWALFVQTIVVAAPNPRRVPCKFLQCSCDRGLPVSDAIEIILNHSKNRRLYTLALRTVLDADDLYDFLYALCYATLRVGSLFEDLFVPLLKHQTAVHRLAFAAKGMGHDRLFQQICNASSTYSAEVQNAERFGNLLLTFLDFETVESRQRAYSTFCANVFPNVPIFIPGQNEYMLEEIRVEEILRLSSSTRPLIVPCVCRQMSTGRLSLVSILVKNESVLTDAFAMIFKSSIAKALQIPAVTYHVQPLSPQTGLLTMVTHASTLCQINEQGTILNHILSKNPTARVKDVQESFARSVALSCCMSHCLALGDRHLQNIMIRDDGLLFHIDFGLSFGAEPLHLRSVRTMTMKLSTEIVDALGGRHSPLFRMFETETIRFFNYVRSDIKRFYYTFIPLSLIQQLSPEDLKEHIYKYLLPDLTNVEGTIYISDSIRKNTEIQAYDGMLDKIKFIKSTWFTT
jgi:phosphatidylinositol 3-kinase